ncbi:hypothetical protein SAMN04487912_105280 [Arthrobacter sp. cf158]|uniref:hypothetical protein n=1 Tax=Arthrobacter sp. cf158 TaxID=1761744 RepID=UPI0008950A74|nr:hypothetical protein [Arthrobacter sp. cf158]SDW89712.1 hypothetical protein SAMN04487912_105280 [Arthrobacter sp. cf158]
MRAIDLETRVLTAVEQIRKGQQVEHDFIECKRSWPQENKARQLAGSLNRAGGDPVIYIIGIDEDSGQIFDVSGTDVLDWWNQIGPQFDQTGPELIRHMPVVINSDGEQVVALAFASDRAPYVVKVGDSPKLEVPMREGTGTRSAKRDELLRLLIPAVSVPSTVMLKASFKLQRVETTIDWQQVVDFKPSGEIRIYFEHNSSEPVTLPSHGMSASLIADGSTSPLRIRPARGLVTNPASGRYLVGPVVDGVALDVPKAVSFELEFPAFDEVTAMKLQAGQSFTYEIEFEVLNAQKTIRVTAELSPDDIDPQRPNVLCAWSYKHPRFWPAES